MSILSISNLSSWLKMLYLLSLARQSTSSPINIINYNSLVDVTDNTDMVNNSPTSSANESATSMFSSTSLGAPVAECATLPNYPEWFQASEKFDIGDVPKALELFYTDYTRDHDGTKYEFLASGVTPVHGIPTQRVPLKVAYGASSKAADQDMVVNILTLGLGTCAIVIAMRNQFVKGELPGETPSKSAGSDISSFTQLYQNALDIYAKCSEPEVNQPGWYPAGDLNSIGIFIWQAASEINQRVHAAPPMNPNLTSASRFGLIGNLFGDTA